MRILNIDFPPRAHVPDLEGTAINQMPKAGWRDLRLMRFENTDLYQWVGKRGLGPGDAKWSPLEEDATPVFLMTPESGSIHAIVEAAKILAEKWNTPGQQVDSNDWFRAVHDVCDTVTGGKSLTLAEFVANTPNPGQVMPNGIREAETILRRHQSQPGDIGVHLGNFPHIFEAFETISHDGGNGAGHARYYVPSEFADEAQLAGWNYLLSRLTKEQIWDYVLGEEGEKQMWIREQAEPRRTMLTELDAFLNNFFEDWNAHASDA